MLKITDKVTMRMIRCETKEKGFKYVRNKIEKEKITISW